MTAEEKEKSVLILKGSATLLMVQATLLLHPKKGVHPEKGKAQIAQVTPEEWLELADEVLRKAEQLGNVAVLGILGKDLVRRREEITELAAARTPQTHENCA